MFPKLAKIFAAHVAPSSTSARLMVNEKNCKRTASWTDSTRPQILPATARPLAGCTIPCLMPRRRHICKMNLEEMSLRVAVLRIRSLIHTPRSGSISTTYGSESGSRFSSGSFYHQAKTVRKTLIPTVLWLLYDFSSFEK